MTHFRLRYKQAGGHVHCRLFAGPQRNLTHGKCGDVTMTDDEFADFRNLVESADFDIVPEDVSVEFKTTAA